MSDIFKGVLYILYKLLPKNYLKVAIITVLEHPLNQFGASSDQASLMPEII